MKNHVTTLRVTRTAAGLSQAALAERIGSYQKRISRIERGTSPPVPEEVEKIAEALGCVSPEKLFAEVPE